MARFLLAILIGCMLLEASSSLKLKTYESITKAQELMEAKKYAEAKLELDEYYQKIQDIAYDRAYMQTYYGYLYILKERYDLALESYRKAYDAAVLPEDMQQNLLYNLAQLYMSSEAYAKGIEALEQWMQKAKSISDNDYIMMAQGYVQLKRYPDALSYVKKAIAQSDTAHENYYQMLFFLQYEVGDIDSAISTMRQMIGLFKANKTYWMQLSGVYAQKQNDGAALCALDIAYREGLLETPEEHLQLVSMKRSLNMPYDAAKLLEEMLKNEQIVSDKKHLKLLGDTWIQAREYQNAIAAYLKAAKQAKEGTIYMDIARLYVDAQQYKDALNMTDKALAKGLKSEGEAYFIKALALFEQKKVIEAKKAFEQAAKDPLQHKRASEWIKYLSR